MRGIGAWNAHCISTDCTDERLDDRDGFVQAFERAMFNRWHEAVLAEGTATSGTVADASHVDWTIPSRGFQETHQLRLRIRAVFPDGTSTEFISKVPLHEVQHLAGNPVLDLPALVTAILAETGRSAAAAGPDALEPAPAY